MSEMVSSNHHMKRSYVEEFPRVSQSTFKKSTFSWKKNGEISDKFVRLILLDRERRHSEHNRHEGHN